MGKRAYFVQNIPQLFFLPIVLFLQKNTTPLSLRFLQISALILLGTVFYWPVINFLTGSNPLNPEENFTQASINVEKKETKKVKKSTDSDKDDLLSQLKSLKELLDAGAITQDEFTKAKKKLLD